MFGELIEHAQSLITDVFGNYVIQKLLEYGNDEQRERLAVVFKGQVLTLTLHMYGCRVIQKALECVPSPSRVRSSNAITRTERLY